MTIGTVYTGFGFWNVYAWMMFFALGALIVLYIRSTGRSDYEKGTYQDEVFYGGNPVPQNGQDLAVPASSSYGDLLRPSPPFITCSWAFTQEFFRTTWAFDRYGSRHFDINFVIGRI